MQFNLFEISPFDVLHCVDYSAFAYRGWFQIRKIFKVHLTPNFFPRQKNSVIVWSISSQKFFDLVESLIFCARLKYGK